MNLETTNAKRLHDAAVAKTMWVVYNLDNREEEPVFCASEELANAWAKHLRKMSAEDPGEWGDEEYSVRSVEVQTAPPIT